LPALLQRPPQFPVAPVHFIGDHPARGHPVVQRPFDQFQGQLGLGAEADRRGDAHRPTPVGLGEPRRGHEQRPVDQRVARGTGRAEEDPHVAVGDLPQSPTVLPRHADGMLALLGKAGLVDDQDAVGVTQLGDDPAPQVVPHGIGVPGGAVEDPLDPPGMSVASVLGELPAVLALDIGQESPEVVHRVAVGRGTTEAGAQEVCHLVDHGRHLRRADLFPVTSTDAALHTHHLPRPAYHERNIKGTVVLTNWKG